MDNIFEIDMILNKKKYSKIYNPSILIIIIILIFIYIIFTYKYQSYYVSKGKMVDNKLELIININDLKYIQNNHTLKIDDQTYRYQISSISMETYVDETYESYKYIYLEINNLTNIDNYVYEIKIPKENKYLSKYLKEYLWGGNMELNEKQMHEVNGGVAWGIIAAIIAGLIFIVGGASGYTNPTRCNN